METITSSNANGASVGYTYDDLNRLSTVVDYNLSGQNTTTYTYDPASNVATVKIPNGLQSSFTYDQLNRLTAMNVGTGSYSYQLGPTGNRTSATEGNGRTLNWSYDGIYRLTNESISGDPSNNNGSAAYDLDPVGNRLSQTSSLPGINTTGFGTYNADDEVSSESYDANGNTTKEANGNNYTYDSENHMTSMTNGSTVVSMIYDALGNRVAKTVNGVTTQYLVDDLNPTGLPQVVEETVNDAVQRQYTYGLQLISENQLVGSAWTTSFYETDGTGSVRQLTDGAGSVTDTYDYDAFGNKVNSTGTTPNNYLYRGEQFDPDLSLYYLRARYYDPVTGRFLSVDPEAGEGQRGYEYAGADPVNGMDPTGNEDIVEYAVAVDIQPVPTPRWGQFCNGLPYVKISGIDPSLFQCPPPFQPRHEVTVSFWPAAADGFGHVGVGVDSPMFNEFTWGFATLNPKSYWKERSCANEPGKVKHDQDTYPFSDVDYMRIPTDAADADAMQQAIDNRINNPGNYNVCLRNCVDFVEDVLHAGNVGGVPGHNVFIPRDLWNNHLIKDRYFWYPWINW